MSGFLGLFSRRTTGLAATDYITLELNPDDLTQYRLVRVQAEEGAERATTTELRPGTWDGAGIPPHMTKHLDEDGKIR